MPEPGVVFLPLFFPPLSSLIEVPLVIRNEDFHNLRPLRVTRRLLLSLPPPLSFFFFPSSTADVFK